MTLTGSRSRGSRRESSLLAVFPSWSPNGREIAFSSHSVAGAPDGGVFRMAASGIGAPERLTRSALRQFPTGWTPDGERILLDAVVGGGTDILLLTLAPTPQVTPLIVGPGFDETGVVSRDGKWLAYTTDASGRNEVFLRPFPDVNTDRIPIRRRAATCRSGLRADTSSITQTSRATCGSSMSPSIPLAAPVVSKPRKLLDSPDFASPRDSSG